MNEHSALERAERHTFVAGVGDAGELLCRANLRYGLAKIHHLQRRLGLPDNAAFIGAPDATVTRNRYRWDHGFGYGGVLLTGADLAILDSKPNGCGMLVGELAESPAEEVVRRAAREAQQSPLELDGVQLEYDLHESNHFVDACELEEVIDSAFTAALPRDIFILHSSGREHRPHSPFGPGLYIDESAELAAVALRHDTPWGPIHALVGQQAGHYFDFCQRVQHFNQRRRALFGQRLFGAFRTICNVTHQGMRDAGRFYLGAYWCEPGLPFVDAQRAATPAGDQALLDSRTFPLTLGPDRPVYLVQARPSLSEQTIEQLGWADRAASVGVLDALRDAMILPHGGGYDFGMADRVTVETRGGRRVFALERRAEAEPRTVDDVRALPFGYRDEVVLERAVELDLLRPIARYRVRFVVKR